MYTNAQMYACNTQTENMHTELHLMNILPVHVCVYTVQCTYSYVHKDWPRHLLRLRFNHFPTPSAQQQNEPKRHQEKSHKHRSMVFLLPIFNVSVCSSGFLFEFKVCLRVAPVAGDNRRGRARDQARSYIYFSRSFQLKTGKFKGEIRPPSRTCTPLEQKPWSTFLNLFWSRQADLGGWEWNLNTAGRHAHWTPQRLVHKMKLDTKIWQKQSK